jgi:p-hydroxybenzoate 3-monooxygenase
MADVSVLAPALVEFFDAGRTELLDQYSEVCLPRVWRAQRFSAWMTNALHRLPGMDEFKSRLQLAELESVVNCVAASTSLAENYVGFPLPPAAQASLSATAAKSDSCGPVSTYT